MKSLRVKLQQKGGLDSTKNREAFSCFSRDFLSKIRLSFTFLTAALFKSCFSQHTRFAKLFDCSFLNIVSTRVFFYLFLRSSFAGPPSLFALSFSFFATKQLQIEFTTEQLHGEAPFKNTLSRDRHKSVPYLKLKNSKKDFKMSSILI